MSEEVTNETEVQAPLEDKDDKNWKAMREENKALKEELVKYQTQERDTLFQQVGLDRTKGVGKAAGGWKAKKVYSRRTCATKPFGNQPINFSNL